MQITDFVKNNQTATFSHFRADYLYYFVEKQNGTFRSEPDLYIFPVPIQDLDGATVYAEMKAITLMRYIRKAIADNTMVSLSYPENN